MAAEIKLHYFQKALLKKLLEAPGHLRFNDLLLEGLESEHMNYHLHKLIEFHFVQKEGTKYILTDQGKDYGNLMDTETEFVERQPKTSVLIIGARINEKTGKEEFLLSKRLRQPYYGKVGKFGGKVRFGETLEQAVARELYEETGLRAATTRLVSIYHKIRKRENGECIQDVIFYMFYMADFSGTFIAKTAYQENFWDTAEAIMSREDLFDTFSLKTMLEYATQQLEFSEDIGLAKDF